MGELPFHYAHALIDEEIVLNTMGRSLVTGTGAETYRAFYYDRGMPGFSLFDFKALNTWTIPRIKRYIKEELIKQTHPILASLISESTFLNRIESVFENSINAGLPATKQADIFYLTARCQRMVVAGQQLLDSYYSRMHPFLNDDVVNTMLNLPAGLKLHSKFHRKFIEDVSLKLAKLPWDKTQQPLNKGLSFTVTYSGLTSKLRLNAQFGKQTKPMYQYNYSGLNMRLLDQSLSLISENENEISKLREQIKSHNLEHYIIGFGLVWLNLNPKFQYQKAG